MLGLGFPSALQHGGAKTPWDLGSDLYVWGKLIPDLEDAEPGDILQFEGVVLKWTTPIKGGKTTYTVDLSPRHTAIVEKVDRGLFLTTLNANVGALGGGKHKKTVQRVVLNLSTENIQSGTVYLYRPIKK